MKIVSLALMGLAVLQAVVGGVVGPSGATMTGTASVGSNVFSVGCFSVGAFVWSQSPSVSTKKGVRSVSVSIDVRYDSNGNCAADATDASLKQATVGVELRTPAGAVVGSTSGSTGGNGTASVSFSSVASGSYQVYVASITSSTATWNPELDRQNPVSVTVP